MGQAGHGADLAQEPLGLELEADGRLQHLDRDGPFVLEVARQIDGRHGATAQLLHDPVPIRQSAGDGFVKGASSGSSRLAAARYWIRSLLPIE